VSRGESLVIFITWLTFLQIAASVGFVGIMRSRQVVSRMKCLRVQV
jgi:hypothetical protein